MLSHTIHSISKVETIQMPINLWIKNCSIAIQWSIMSIIYISVIHKKECNAGIHFNMDEPQKHAKWEKPVSKTPMIPFIGNIQNKQICREKADWWFLGLHDGEIGKWLLSGYQVAFWSDENIVKLDRSDENTR